MYHFGNERKLQVNSFFVFLFFFLLSQIAVIVFKNDKEKKRTFYVHLHGSSRGFVFLWL